MAAHLEGKGSSVLDFTGFAQKFGPVLSFIRLGADPGAINQVRIDTRGADAVIGCDVVVSSSPKASACYRPGTRVALNLAEMPTGDVVRQRDARLDVTGREAAIAEAVGPENVASFDANGAAERLLGDSVFANVMMLGFAWQQGLVPVSFEALARAIELNGVAIDRNMTAFSLGRILAARPDALARQLDGPARREETLDDLIGRRADFLAEYQDRTWADRFNARIGRFRATGAPEDLVRHAVRSLFKLMSYKDEYEVARLHTRTGFAEGLSRDFEGDFTVNYHLAPPFLPLGKDARGRPRKRRFGPWMSHAFGALARMKRVRGTVFDPFGYTGERRMERALIGWYEDLLESCPRAPVGEQHARWARILSAPMDIRGYGPVKSEAVDRVKTEVAALLKE